MSEYNKAKWREFFTTYEWEDESTGFACNGNARLVLEAAKRELGVSGGIWEVFIAHEEGIEVELSHSYVVLDIQVADEMALNQQYGTRARHVGEVISRGRDITQKILNMPWDKLR